jgi:AraC family transcriptional regulator
MKGGMDMDWITKMNEIIEIIEDQLTENIDYTSLSKTAECSTYEFSRIFSFITEMSLSEYIRKRRLSIAALDICKSDMKIIDIAIK